MAISATFEAQFGSFFDAVDKAVAKLGDVEKAAATVGPRLDKMTSRFSGDKVIQDAALMVKAIESVGGASALTERELAGAASQAQEAAAKIRALGGEVPPALQKIADAAKPVEKNVGAVNISFTDLAKTLLGGFGIQQAISFAKQFATELLGDADALMKLHDKTGVAMQTLQKFQIAGDDAGNSLDEITSAIVKMEDKLAGGDKSAFKALDDLKIPFEDIKNLKPENQFIAISEAIGKVKDPAEQVRLAIDLFGKSGAEILPTLKRGFGDLKDATVGMSDDTIKNLDLVGDTMSAWYRSIKGSTANAIVDFGRFVKDGMDPATHAMMNMEREAASLKDQLKEMGEAIPDPRKWGAALPEIKIDSSSVQQGIKDLESAQKKIDEANAKTLKAIEDYNNAQQKLKSTWFGGDVIDKALEWVNTLGDINRLAIMTRDQQAAWNKVMGDAIDAYHAMHNDAPEAMYAIYTATQKPLDEIKDLQAVLKTTAVETIPLFGRQTVSAMGEAVTGMKGLERASSSLKSGLEGTLKDIPNTIIAAFTGGGGMSGAIMAIGMQLGQDFSNALTESINKTMAENKKKEGAGGIASSIFTGGNVAMAGGAGAMAGIGSMASGASVGQSIGSVAGMGMSVAVMGGMTTGAIALGAATMGIGTAAVFAYYGIKKLIQSAKDRKETNKLREDFIDLNGGLEKVNESAWKAGASLDALLAAKTPDQVKAALEALQSSFEFQKAAIEDVNATAQKYGFTIEELGPALQRQALDQQAQDLFHDFEVLNAAGIDTVAITNRMGEATSDYINTAIKMGSEVPDAMRPMLEEMVKAGTLTDANGDAITDLESAGVKFSLTMTEGFKQMISSVDKLAEVISRSLGVALDDTNSKIKSIPKNIDVEVNYKTKGGPAATEAPEGLEGFASGTGGFRNFGKGTPVMLHGWEAVVPRASASQGGGGAPGEGGPTIIINAQGAFFDTPESQQRLADKVSAALTNKYGLSNKFRAA